MSSDILTLLKAVMKTKGPVDICLIPGPMGVPTPAPFPGENIPALWAGASTKVMVNGVPVLLLSSESPLCKPHGGPLGACGPGMLMGIGKIKFIITLLMMIQIEGKSPVANNSLGQLNSGNTPPAQASGGDGTVSVG